MHVRVASRRTSERRLILTGAKRMPFGQRTEQRRVRSAESGLSRIYPVIAAALFLLCTGCHHSADVSSRLAIEFETKPVPAQVGVATATFTITDAAGVPVTGGHFSTEADMTHAGMSPVFGEVQEVRPGRYESRLDLAMAGDWVILLHGTLANGEKLERQFDLRNVRPNQGVR